MSTSPSFLRPLCRSVLTLLLVLAMPQIVLAKKGKSDKPSTPESASAKTLAKVTEGTEKLDGLVTFYRSHDKLYMQLPPDLEGAPLGFATVRVHAGGDFLMRGGSVDNQLVRWKRRGDKLVLVKENLDFRAEKGSTMERILESSFNDSPVFAAPLEQLSDEAAPLLIDASKLFGPDLTRLFGRNAGYSVKADDGILISLKVFADNVVARVVYRARQERGGGGGGSNAGNPFARFMQPARLPDTRNAEVTIDYNFYRLEDDGYRPRAADERIGGMVLSYKDYSDVDNEDTLFRHLLRRFDLRKADPAAAISDPVEPITFYMDYSVPEQWRDAVREATLWWNTAFEKAGVSNAVRVLDPPEGEDWDPAELNHSVIYWNFSDDLVFSGVAGPVLADPRNGKTIKATVHLNGEFFSYGLHRYLVYAWWRAPDPGAGAETLQARRKAIEALRNAPGSCDRAASFSSQMAFARMVLRSRGVIQSDADEADRFIREAFAELVTHEVGHALGFPHNWKASLISDWEDVKTNKVNGRMGPQIFSSSVMDYNPIYLAPRGMSQGDYFMKELGPYDDLFVDYIYRPLGHLSPGEEARALDAIAARAEVEPGLIFDDGGLGNIDPTTNSDDIGDDPLAFAESRLAMLREEVLPNFHELVLDEGHDYNLLRQALDSAIFSVAMDYIDITARHVGGQVLLRRVATSVGAPAGGPPPITPIPAADQRRALRILDEHLFAEGALEIPAEALALLKADLLFDWNYPWRYASDYNVGQRIAGLYDAALSTLFEPARLTRVMDNERRFGSGQEIFTLPDLFDHLQETVFSPSGNLAAERRALQRLYLNRMIHMLLEPERGTPAEASQLAAASLRSILGDLKKTLAGGDQLDGYTRAHMEDLAARAQRTLKAGVQFSVE